MISWPLFAISIAFLVIGVTCFGLARRGEQNTLGGLIAIIALVIAALGGLARVAGAHDHARPELNDWFNKLQSGKGLCCSDSDGTAVADPDWESKAGHYRVRLEGEWHDVPDDAVITEPNRAGRTMVWPIKGSAGLTIRCFMPGSMT